jgi:dipeptidyl aminopeptidase/acylaminoacyl peptidase
MIEIILLVGGTYDNDVPFSATIAMADQLKELGVACELIQISGGGHGFEETAPAEIEIIIKSALDFIST